MRTDRVYVHCVCKPSRPSVSTAAARRHGPSSGDDIDVRLDACFSDFRVKLSSSRVWVAGLDMANLQLGAELRPDRTRLTASLRQFAVTDLTPNIKRDKVGRGAVYSDGM